MCEGEVMNREIFYKHEGYQQGLIDGKRTEGQIKEKYLKNLLISETQNLSNEESQQYKKGWQDGFTDAVSRLLLTSKVMRENCLINQMFEF
jgi:hypothetical protein